LQAEWLATFDQDSEPAADFVYQMLSAVSECASPERVGLIAPVCVDANGFNKKADRSSDVQGHELTTAITSGNLVRLRALQESGGFRESFFIDYVDHELCFRLRRSGWRVIQASTAVLFHRLGKISEHHLFGKLVTTTNHSAGRRFTISRNRVWVYREYGLREFEWAVRDVASFLKEIVKIAMFEQQKIRKLLAVFRGVLSGLTSSPSKATRYLADATALTAKRPVAIANGRSNSQR
jgi:rhamnosyltransferase